MKRIIDFVLGKKKTVVFTFSVVGILSLLLQFFVVINYNLQSYLPEETPSTDALEIMSEQYQETIFSVTLMLPNAEVNDALEMKRKIFEIDEVVDVLWLDDYIDVTIPTETYPQDLIDQYYKQKNALFFITVETDNYPPVLEQLQNLGGHVSGRMVELSMAQSATQAEISQIMIFVIPLVMVVLILATHSWLEPLIMLITIGIGILLNMGTNIFFKEISFLTQAVASILQLAVSMDYAIFLLHRFNDYRAEYETTEMAMKEATKDALPTLMASSITTFIGFLALVLMRFKIGPDMGIVLAKGVAFSLISVLFLLPSLTLMMVKWIDKTTHRSFIPRLDWLGKVNFKVMPILVSLVFIIAVPSFLAQRKNTFMYGLGGFETNSREANDLEIITNLYGEETQIVILVPKERWAQEQALIKELESLDEVKSILSYVSMIGPNIPYELLPKDDIKSFISEDYSRLILQVESADEGEHAFDLVETIRMIIDKYYPDEGLVVGSSVITYDMAKTIQADDFVVNTIAIGAIFFTILLTFRSISIPMILVFAIEISIWINLSVPYFTQSPLNYIGYLIISTVQLGATVDYGVLYTQNYLENRQIMNKKEAFFKTSSQSAQSILPPALILMITGFILGQISSIQMVSELGYTLGRGALLSMILVLLFVPACYYLFDKFVEKTTLRTQFLRKEVNHENT